MEGNGLKGMMEGRKEGRKDGWMDGWSASYVAHSTYNTIDFHFYDAFGF
jgi:hypothetical protein